MDVDHVTPSIRAKQEATLYVFAGREQFAQN